MFIPTFAWIPGSDRLTVTALLNRYDKWWLIKLCWAIHTLASTIHTRQDLIWQMCSFSINIFDLYSSTCLLSQLWKRFFFCLPVIMHVCLCNIWRRVWGCCSRGRLVLFEISFNILDFWFNSFCRLNYVMLSCYTPCMNV